MNIPKVNISEIFDSIQGEGHLVGHFTKFIRFQGCSIGCSWCDSKNTWKSGKGKQWNSFDLAKHTITTLRNHQWVCITGGEPLEQYKSLYWIVNKFERAGIKNICMETCGYPVNDVIDIIDLYNTGMFFSISPKLPSALKKRFDPNAMKENILLWYNNIPVSYMMQLKYVVSIEEDLQAIYNFHNEHNLSCHLFIQIENSKINDAKFIKKGISLIEALPNFRLNIQQHKILGLR